MKNLMKSAMIALSALLLTGVSTQAQERTIQVATEGAFSPWTFTQSDGTLAGYDIDLLNDLCARLKVKCIVSTHDFASLIPGLNAKKYDMIIDAINITEERLKVVSFTRPYAMETYSFAVMGDTDLKNLPDTNVDINIDTDKDKFSKALADLTKAFDGKILGAQAASTNLDFLQKNFSKTSDVRQYKSTQQHDLDLQSGRIDAIFSSLSGLKATEKQNGFEDFKIVGPVLSGAELGQGTAIVVRKDDNALREQFDDAIGAAIADGTVKRLSEKWFGIDLTPKQ